MIKFSLIVLLSALCLVNGYAEAKNACSITKFEDKVVQRRTQSGERINEPVQVPAIPSTGLPCQEEDNGLYSFKLDGETWYVQSMDVRVSMPLSKPEVQSSLVPAGVSDGQGVRGLKNRTKH